MSPSYPFETPTAFLQDFGVQATFGVLTARVICSVQGEDLLGGKIESNRFELEYQTSAFPGLGYGSAIAIASLSLSLLVLQTYLTDDGVFSRARCETVP